MPRLARFDKVPASSWELGIHSAAYL